jgi:hypothetical protein
MTRHGPGWCDCHPSSYPDAKPKPKRSDPWRPTLKPAMARLAAKRMERANRIVTAEMTKIMELLPESELEKLIAKFSSIPECGRILEDLQREE